jgi:hypothetical protein
MKGFNKWYKENKDDQFYLDSYSEFKRGDISLTYKEWMKLNYLTQI